MKTQTTKQINLNEQKCFVKGCNNLVKGYEHQTKTGFCEEHENLAFSEGLIIMPSTDGKTSQVNVVIPRIDAIEASQITEHRAWVNIWEVLAKLTKLSREELNKPEWRQLAIAIEKWAYCDRDRRFCLAEFGDEREKEYAEDFGLFWRGDN